MRVINFKFYFVMIQLQSYLNVADNTGAQRVMCIQILGSNRKYASIGDIIIVVVKLCFIFFVNFEFFIILKFLFILLKI